MAYDKIFDAIKNDHELVGFLAAKSKKYQTPYEKHSFADIQKNIENRIFRDALKNLHKVHTNYPGTPLLVVLIKSVLGWPATKDAAINMLGEVIERNTSIDGLHEEQGIAAYSYYATAKLASFLYDYKRVDPSLLEKLMKNHPTLHQMARFYSDIFCLDNYYPNIGDSYVFAKKHRFLSAPKVGLLWDMYKITGDENLLKIICRKKKANQKRYYRDCYDSNIEAVEKSIKEYVAKNNGTVNFDLPSVNKAKRHLAILRSGIGGNKRAAWIDYDTGGAHGHHDMMNIGLFAKGLDIMPDFGYPPVMFGGWSAPKSQWYGAAEAHNTVIVTKKDGTKAQPDPTSFKGSHLTGKLSAAKTTLWADGKNVHLIRLAGAHLINNRQYERTLLISDQSDDDFYVLDIFRVAGGVRHDKFQRSTFGQLSLTGANPTEKIDYGSTYRNIPVMMRNFKIDNTPSGTLVADWKLDDVYNYLPDGKNVHFRYTDLTKGAKIVTGESWVCYKSCHGGDNNKKSETWLPHLIIRTESDKAPLKSTFVSFMEVYEASSNIKHIRRLCLTGDEGHVVNDSNVAVEITFHSGAKELVISRNVKDSNNQLRGKSLAQNEWDVAFDGELCLIGKDKGGNVTKAAIFNTSFLKAGNFSYKNKKTPFMELFFNK